jgi:hypothetical protein
MKKIPGSSILLFIFYILASCSHPAKSGLLDLYSKDKVNLEITYFFDKKYEAEIQNLDVPVTVGISKTLLHPLSQDHYAKKYDANETKSTKESLDEYLHTLETYNRFIIDFKTDSLSFKISATPKMDITHIIMVDRYNERYRFVNEYYFVYGTILKVIETEKKSVNGKDFNEAIDEKKTTSLFDENKLFYKSIMKQGQETAVSYTDEEARQMIQDAFMLRQFCRDVALKIKESHADWFKMEVKDSLGQ